MSIFTEQPKKLNIAKDRLIKGSTIPELPDGYHNVLLVEIPNYLMPVNVTYNGITKLITQETHYDIQKLKSKWNKPDETLKVRYYAVNTLFGKQLINSNERKNQDVI